MNFQILDADYTYSEGKPVVRLYGRDESGNSVCCSVPGFEPYFYAKSPHDFSDVIQEKFKENIKRIDPVSRFEPIGYFKDPVPMLKITLLDPKGVPVIRDDVRKLVDDIYETDILFRNRYLIDSGLGGMGWANADVSPEFIETEVISTIKITSKKSYLLIFLRTLPCVILLLILNACR